jgi:hypothetical protein
VCVCVLGVEGGQGGQGVQEEEGQGEQGGQGGQGVQEEEGHLTCPQGTRCHARQPKDRHGWTLGAGSF